MKSIYEFHVKDINGNDLSMSEFIGKVLLMVNTASKCGFTPQYKSLEALHQQHNQQGLVVMGFPCDQFGNQEPGDETEIKNFCSLTYDVHFQMFSKIDVNGHNTHPLYKFLKAQSPGLLGSTAVKWNFTKFLVGRDGKVIDRYAPMTNPESMKPDIENALKIEH